jgi:hypothetical protein
MKFTKKKLVYMNKYMFNYLLREVYLTHLLKDGIGGVFRENRGTILIISMGYKGIDTKKLNSATSTRKWSVILQLLVDLVT